MMTHAVVVAVVDGDTVKLDIAFPPEGVKERETVRLIGVDTPETVDPRRSVERFGKEASDFTRANLLGATVFIAFDQDLRDYFGRLLAYLYVSDGACFNRRIIEEGYGFAYTKYPFAFREEFLAAQQRAREAPRGLWAPLPE